MTEWVLSGNGIQALTPGLSRIYVYVSTPARGYSTGTANPVNYYKTGTLRFGVSGLYGPPQFIFGDAIFLDVPAGTTDLGYAIPVDGVIHVFDTHP
jgi:hypothetical protein